MVVVWLKECQRRRRFAGNQNQALLIILEAICESWRKSPATLGSSACRNSFCSLDIKLGPRAWSSLPRQPNVGDFFSGSFAYFFRADRATRGLAISFLMRARVALFCAFVNFVSAMVQHCHREVGNTVPFRTVQAEFPYYRGVICRDPGPNIFCCFFAYSPVSASHSSFSMVSPFSG